jgi:hypothetical protein
MNLSQPYRTIREAHVGNSLALAPTTAPEPCAQLWQFSNRAADGDCFYINNLADKLEVLLYIQRLCRRARGFAVDEATVVAAFCPFENLGDAPDGEGVR